MFLPTTKEEMIKAGWDSLDVIIVTGDAYIDVPSSGTALIGKFLVSKGFRVGVISQPRCDVPDDIMQLGEPTLFWGVNSGCVDSMVANYTAVGKPRKSCDFTAGGENTKRPDRAIIIYTGLIKRWSKGGAPILLGGIEASLRRTAHYDNKTEKIRRSILFDAKADVISYGNGELSVIEFAEALRDGRDWHDIDGLCFISKDIPIDSLELPSYEDAAADKNAFHKMFAIFYANSDSVSGKRLVQKTGDRYLVQNKPSQLSAELLDEVNELSYEREVHPLAGGEVRAIETVRFSVSSHRGCFGGCSFCAITVHQGRRVVSRSISSIVREVTAITRHKRFKGIISDIGGATANMYGMTCAKMEKLGACRDKRCLYPQPCKSMDKSHKKLLDMLAEVSKIPNIRKIFASSGVRCDLVLADSAHGLEYIEKLAAQHVSGQLKLAPESADDVTLDAMKKPSADSTAEFIKLFDAASRKAGKEQYVTCYFMAAHPAATENAARKTKAFADKYLRFTPEQVQIFTPTPSTWSTCMYHTGFDEEGNEIFCERGQGGKERQKESVTGKRMKK